jgi:hypothetical protein
MNDSGKFSFDGDRGSSPKPSESSSKVRSFSRRSSSSVTDALDYFADMCEEIDDMFVTMTSPSPQVQSKQKFFPPNPLGKEADPAPGHAKRSQLRAVPEMGDFADSNGDTMPIPLKIMKYGDGIASIVPSNPADMEKLLTIGGSRKVILISLEIVEVTSPTVVKQSKEAVSSIDTTSINPTDLISPKHIYNTSCDTFRVQISKGSKVNPNGKFSRNARNEIDAFWLCECALILVDRPSCFQDMLVNGNYKCLVQRSLVSSPEDYDRQLRDRVGELYSRKLLKRAEYEKIAAVLLQQQPSVPIVGPGMQSEGVHDSQIASSDDEDSQKGKASTLSGWGSLLSSQWKSFSNQDRKKRRRIPKNAPSPSGSGAQPFFPESASASTNEIALHDLTADFVRQKYVVKREDVV